MKEHLPIALVSELEAHGGLARVGEVHLRAGRLSSVTVEGVNCPLIFRATREILDEILLSVTGGSIYAYRDSIRAGYISLAGGIRMGLAGRAITEGDVPVAVTDLTSLCFRIPHAVPGVASDVIRLWETNGAGKGILVIAPPACGKTTFLKDLIIGVSSGVRARRVAVVDSREELCPDGTGEMVDVLRGYPRRAGMEIALRTLSPEVLICDEIGAEEVISIRDILYGGVPLVAAMHGSSLTQIKKKNGVRELLDAGVFGMAVLLGGAARGWEKEVITFSC